MYAYFTPISYQVNLNIGAGGRANSSSINVSYGLTNVFTVTPNSNYYLESITCTNGYTVSGFTTTTSSTGTQTITVANNNKLTGSTCTVNFKALCPYSVGSIWDYSFNDGVQSFQVLCNGTYKLEVWGAQGGNNSGIGGKGGYASGNLYLTKNSTLYIVVGSQGQSTTMTGSWSNTEFSGSAGGYNGGGTGAGFWHQDHVSYQFHYNLGAGGGGATHIAITNRGELKNYSSFTSEVLLVAGGGGGGSYNYEPNENNNEDKIYSTNGNPGGTGGGYSFGIGESVPYNSGSGGGGGWSGGTRGYGEVGANGGTNYIGNITDGVSNSGIREGNGFARIKVLSLVN